MIDAIRNKRWFCQKINSSGVGRTVGGDLDNFYFGYYHDRLIIWEAKHRNAIVDYNGPQAVFLKELVDNLINLEVVLVWVEHDSSEDVVYLKNMKPIKCYYKPKGANKGELRDFLQDVTPNQIANWADRNMQS